MNDTFITKIHINKVRHLHDLDISLSETERKHLILTGKNGSGKTSVLEAMEDIHREQIIPNENCHSYCNDSSHIGFENDDSKQKWWLQLYFTTTHGMIDFFHDLFFIYFPAEHNLKVDEPTAIEKIQPEHSKDVLKYMVSLDYQQLAAGRDHNTDEANRIQQWFDNFKRTLQEVYENNDLSLNSDARNLRFTVKLPDREPFGLNEMADGYKALLNIIVEIMMQLEKRANGDYNAAGIVLIDEIEAHLHVALQKKALPMLTTMFPNIQFIVTTHSPFVMASLKDKAVIYDLEMQTPYMLNEEKSVSAIIRDNLGVSSTMPLWAEDALNVILAKYKTISSDNLSLDEFKKDLDEAGLEDLFPESMAKVLEGR
jgi:predicted ATP-binding protein involved in virulence